MKRLAIIPARGGSKRIPKKNIKYFLGKPIIAYSIECALTVSDPMDICISTNDDDVIEIAKQYARQPDKIANKVYANRMMNGNEASGDGWKYRGRGFIQITGKENYSNLTKDTGIDYLNNPDLLLNEADSMISALWFWNSKRLNSYADNDNIKEITRRINGGYNGLEHRKSLLEKYKAIFI